MSEAPRRTSKPKVIVLHNESPDWEQSDINWAMRFVNKLAEGLQKEGYTVKPLKFFDNLMELDSHDRHEWLVWNWGEEMAGMPWSESIVTAELERLGFAYTGASTQALELARSRMGIKKALHSCGVPTLTAQVFSDPDQVDHQWTTYPAIVKGANQHASFGIDNNSIVYTPEQLAQRIKYMREKYNDDSLVEQFLDSREFQVGVWGNGTPEVLPPMEFDYSMFADMHDRLYTYEWKFNHDSRGYKEIKMPIPAPEDKPHWRKRLQEVALQAYQALNLRDYGRIDMRMFGDEPQVLDVNANPDLDHLSPFVVWTQKQGFSYGKMASHIVELAASRMPA